MSTSRPTGRQVTYEYVLLRGVNDRLERRPGPGPPAPGPQGARQPDPVQRVAGLPTSGRPPRPIRRFVATCCADRGSASTVRKTKGRAIDAACGQLRRRLDDGRLVAAGSGLDSPVAMDPPRWRTSLEDAGPRLIRADHDPEDPLVSRGELDVLERQLEARDPDVRLMLQVRDDVPGAFEALVERYQHRLVGILYPPGRQPRGGRGPQPGGLPADLQGPQGYRPRAKFSTWLFTIANNLALNHLRGKGRNPLGPHERGGQRLADAVPRRRSSSPPGRARPRPRCARSSSRTSSARRSRS